MLRSLERHNVADVVCLLSVYGRRFDFRRRFRLHDDNGRGRFRFALHVEGRTAITDNRSGVKCVCAARDLIGRVALYRIDVLRVHADDIRGALVGVTGGTDLRLAEVGAAAGAVSGILPTGTPVRLSVALDAVREGALEVAVLAFRDWAESSATGDEGAGSTSIHAPDRFAGVAATPIGGENLDDPTWLRRNLRLAL